MKKLFGHTDGLAKETVKKLESLYQFRTLSSMPISPELAQEVLSISLKIGRQIAVLINRAGRVEYVVVGTAKGILLPFLKYYRSIPGRLCGLRYIHTHLTSETFTQDDITDLELLRFDLMGILQSHSKPSLTLELMHLLPPSTGNRSYEHLAPISVSQFDIACDDLISALEWGMSLYRSHHDILQDNRAILISVTMPFHRKKAQRSLTELKELAISCGLEVMDSILQQRPQADPKYVLGHGKLADITIQAMQQGVSHLVFDQELSPSQSRAIGDAVEIKVLDRTQLILDIFAQRAQTREGKLQVELAQLKYRLPRLIQQNRSLSRLAGGIGGRGPGETQLEVDRRRIRDRISRLEKDLSSVSQQRKQQRSQRQKKKIPTVSIVGYTNAGKSTLLNTLTRSDVIAQDRLFATLDPSSRRLKFPQDVEVIITDTVGFIENLPKDLLTAFKATLEELATADLLLHVIDISDIEYLHHIQSVENILDQLHLSHIPVVYIYNKIDQISDFITENNASLPSFYISAINRKTLTRLTQYIQSFFGPNFSPSPSLEPEPLIDL